MTDEEREQQEIQMCLTCPFPKCVNCLSNRADKRMRRQMYRIEQVRDLAGRGLPDNQIAKYLGIGTATVFRLRKEAGIPSGKSVTYGSS